MKVSPSPLGCDATGVAPLDSVILLCRNCSIQIEWLMKYTDEWDRCWDCGDIVCTTTSVQRFSWWPCPHISSCSDGFSKVFWGRRHYLKTLVGQVQIVRLTRVLMTWSLHVQEKMDGWSRCVGVNMLVIGAEPTVISVQRKRLSTHTLALRDPRCSADLHPRQIFRKMATNPVL